MLSYAFRGQNSVTRSIAYNKNFFTIRDEIYAHDNISSDVPFICNYEKIIPADYDIWTTAVKFNNLISKNDIPTAMRLFSANLRHFNEIVSNESNLTKMKCYEVLNKLNEWNEALNNNYNLDSLKWDIVEAMKQWEKDGYIVLSGSNLKKDYYDFS